jgi:glucose/arabinose dehydrogenase
MIARASSVVFFLLLALTESSQAQITMVEAFPGLAFSTPVDIQNSGDGTNRIFVVEQAGRIKVFPNTSGATTAKMYLDIADSVRSGGELGLLGLAFHPDYGTNGYFYVNYTRGTLGAGNLRSVISRFQVSATNPDSAVRASQQVLFEFLQPYENHNGGQMAFGPDGFLYISLGDGGSGGDPQNNGQKLTTLLGKLLRVDVDTTEGSLPYAIPADNPFAGNASGYREEIFAYGLRNPWRFSFDPVSGRLWCGDVGQNAWEEIDTVVNGGNYGWRITEGNNCYNPSVGCNTSGLRFPVYTYSHDSGCSITGGYVYRGSRAPSLYGTYIYTDFCQGDIYSLDISGAGPADNRFVLASGQSVSSFGVDEAQELYLCNIYSGKIYTFVETSPPPVPALLEPADGSTGVNDSTTIRWMLSGPGQTANLVVATDPLFSHVVVDDSLLADTAYAFIAPPGESTFYWKVRSRNSFGYSPFADAWSFTIGSVSSIPVQVRKAWNIVSLPMIVTDSLTVAVFPTATSEAFSYAPGTGYSTSLSLDRGKGYWLKFPQDDTLIVYGEPFHEDTVSVEQGWNVVGTISGAVPTGTIIQEPADNIVSPFYAYQGGYAATTELLPGKAYWVKVQTAGMLILHNP